jgi:hypothetical protein
LDGNFTVWFVPTLANPAAPTVEELNAATTVNLSCYLTGSGFADSADQAAITDDRLCDTFVREQPGRVTPSLEVTFIDNTNSEFEEDFNAAVECLVPGSKYNLVTRRGKAFDAPAAATDRVNVREVIGGMHNEVAPEANSVARSVAKQFIQGYINRAQVVAA